jgi:hypothetical protein
VRALLALPGRLPIKKWAAFPTLGAATFYLLLSGAEVATQCSFIMVAIGLGVMVDRPTLTLRTLTVGALAVLLLAPESIVHPSSRCRMRRRWRSSQSRRFVSSTRGPARASWGITWTWRLYRALIGAVEFAGRAHGRGATDRNAKNIMGKVMGRELICLKM